MLRAMAPFPLQPNARVKAKRRLEAVDYRRMCGTDAGTGMQMTYCCWPGAAWTVDATPIVGEMRYWSCMGHLLKQLGQPAIGVRHVVAPKGCTDSQTPLLQLVQR